jgi:hypothetical protein
MIVSLEIYSKVMGITQYSMHSLSVRLSTEHREGRGRQAGSHDGLAAVTQIQAGGVVVVLLVVRLGDHCVGWLGLRGRVGRWGTLGSRLSQILVAVSEGARGTVFARAHVEVLALGSFKVLGGLSLSTFTTVVSLVVVAAASSLLVSALGLMTTTSATVATTTLVSIVVVLLLISTSVCVLMIVMMSTAAASAVITVSMIILRLLVLALHALVVLLNDGGLSVGVRRYGVRHLAQLVLTMGDEARVGLRARTLLHEVAAKLSLELLGVELGS